MANQSDRLFLEDCCPGLVQKLSLAILEGDRRKLDIPEDLQDFEVKYFLRFQSPESSELLLEVKYPFLGDVLKNGSQALLEREWGTMPLALDLKVDGVFGITLDVAQLAQDPATGEDVVRRLSSVRMYLLIGPLVERLRWLKDTHEKAAVAGREAPPGGANAAAQQVLTASKTPAILELRVRQMETMWIVTKADRVLIIMAVNLDDEVDVALGRAFCQEFAETGRANLSTFSPPCSFNESKDLPKDLQATPPAEMPNVGFLTFTLADQSIKGASEERIQALAKPIMTFRNFFLYHLKHTKSYLHSRLRRRIDGWQHQLTLAKRAPRGGAAVVRRKYDGKKFVASEE